MPKEREEDRNILPKPGHKAMELKYGHSMKTGTV